MKVGEYQAVPIPLTYMGLNDLRADIIMFMFELGRKLQLFDPIINLDCFTGSSYHLMSGQVDDHELCEVKQTLGDIDIQVPYGKKYQLEQFIVENQRIGMFTFKGTMKHGNEMSVLCKYANTADIHQIDFQFVDDPGSINQQFLHSAAWEDIKLGFKGAHHKLLLNAIGLDQYKFSIVNGLSSRSESGPATTHPNAVCTTLFGTKSHYANNTNKIGSFVGTCELMKTYTDPKLHDDIFEKFCRDSNERIKDREANNKAQIHLAKALGATLSVG